MTLETEACDGTAISGTLAPLNVTASAAPVPVGGALVTQDLINLPPVEPAPLAPAAALPVLSSQAAPTAPSGARSSAAIHPSTERTPAAGPSVDDAADTSAELHMGRCSDGAVDFPGSVPAESKAETVPRALLRLCSVLPAASWALGSRLLAMLSHSAALPAVCEPSASPGDLPVQLLAASKGPCATGSSAGAIDGSGSAPAGSGPDAGGQSAWLAAAAALRSACCAPEQVYGIPQVNGPCLNRPPSLIIVFGAALRALVPQVGGPCVCRLSISNSAYPMSFEKVVWAKGPCIDTSVIWVWQALSAKNLSKRAGECPSPPIANHGRHARTRDQALIN